MVFPVNREIIEGAAVSTALLLHQLAAGGEIDRASSVAEYIQRLLASHGG